MLPTAGHFQEIDCPYHESKCGRPYCHFRHRKKAKEAKEESQKKHETVPTYKPTPKSELANTKSHIPISYVPDLVIRTGRTLRPIPSYSYKDKPTYKATPKSLLPATNITDEYNVPETNNSSVYNPTPITKPVEVDEGTSQDNEINLDLLSGAFDMIDEILSESGENDKLAEESNSNLNTYDTVELNVDNENKNEDDNKIDDDDNKNDVKAEEIKSISKNKDKKHEKDDRHRKDKYSRSSSRSSKSKHRDKEKEKDKKDPKRDKERKDKEKSKSSSDKHRSSSSSSSNSKKKKDEHDRDKKKHREKSKEHSSSKSKRSESIDSKFDIQIEDDFSFEGPISDDDEVGISVEEECMKIFNEYKPPEPVQNIAKPVIAEINVCDDAYKSIVGKKRIAYDNADKSILLSQPTIKTPVPNVAYIMTNRIRIARQAHANNEQTNLMNEIKQQNLKRPTTTTTIEYKPKVPKLIPKPKPVDNGVATQPTCLIDDILSGKASSKPRKIAPVMNVTSIQRAKAKLDEMAKTKAAQALKTSAQSINKGAKRVAHVPDNSLSNIPDVLHADKSKLPVNVRTRYLTLLADECIKLYASNDEAYQRALQEEFKCYERCTALATYRNSTMLAVNRLRKEVQERELSGLGPLQGGAGSLMKTNSPFYGQQFYDNIKKFMLSEDELILHGYPRECAIPGRAVITADQRQPTIENLERNQRLCCRCHTVYLIDDDGFPLIQMECNYHPLKKRTFRGERFYLCCKSTEDTGCVLSNSHVSEATYDRELEGYQSTMESDDENDPRNFAVYALDCEMCYTTKGLELTRVTIVDVNLKTVYESLVKPLNTIIDYNTRFSGITEDQMERTSTSLLQVQANILHLCNSKTILIGHSLESDMKALKIIHSSVVDTSIMFPHKFGLPHKRALRALASEHLKKIIQNSVGGHDSAEDALACMELVIWKVKEELKVRGVKY